MKLIAEGIEKRYDRLHGSSNYFCAVQKTDLTLEAGRLIEITGRSGSGKSTLLNMLAGLLQPTQGRVLLDGADLYALPDRQLSALRNRHIGVVPQGQTALHSLTVLENVLLPAQLQGRGPLPEERARMLLEKVGIGPLAHVRPAELSGGELRRMAIARALIRQPDVLLADEPTGDLDDENTAAVLRLLRDAAREGAAVLLVTHEAEAVRYADAVYRMDAGALTGPEEGGFHTAALVID